MMGHRKTHIPDRSYKLAMSAGKMACPWFDGHGV
jgi:uncharacterized protein YodC (DUF2158 family)